MVATVDDSNFNMKELLLLIPSIGSALALTWEVGRFYPIDCFFYFSISEHVVAAIYALPFALFFLAIFMLAAHAVSGRGENRKIDRAGFAILAASLFFLAYIAGESVTIFFAAAGFLIWAIFYPSAKGLPGILTVITVTLSAAFGLGVDFTRLELAASPDLVETISTKTGDIKGRVIMSGERAVLIYRPDSVSFELRKPDEVLSIAWPKLRDFSKKTSQLEVR